jgi:hypothetical protein
VRRQVDEGGVDHAGRAVSGPAHLQATADRRPPTAGSRATAAQSTISSSPEGKRI